MLQKQAVDISFALGLDTKTDPFRVELGKFLALSNSQFDKNGQLTKRNGFGLLPALPEPALITTFAGNLTGIGAQLYTYTGVGWNARGASTRVGLSVQPVVRSAANQTQCDSATIGDITCVVYTETANSTTSFKYAIVSNANYLVGPVALPSVNTTYGTPRVWALGKYFVIVYTSVTPALVYIAIPSTSLVAGTPTTISSTYAPLATVGFDGVVANNNLYLAYNGSDGGGAVRVTYLDSTLAQHGTKIYTSHTAVRFSLAADTTGTTPVIYVTWSESTQAYTSATDQALNAILAPMNVVTSSSLLNLVSYAQNGAVNIVWELADSYSYDSGIPTNRLQSATVTSGGTKTSHGNLLRSVGLASKAFQVAGVWYFLTAYQSPNQSTYFLVNESAVVVAKLAYENGGGYVMALPNAANGMITYLFKDLIASVNTGNSATSVPSAATNAIYTQTGINLVAFDFAPTVSLAETAKGLHISGGVLSLYDGNAPTEHGFFLYPDSVEGTTSTTGGALAHQIYYYQVVYTWTDAQGNVHTSAPSIPNLVDASGSSTATNTNTIHIPTLRLTNKANVKIDIYRWSTAQQTFYRITSITNPLLNDPTNNSVTYVDTAADSSIIGNQILYTTGGVLENIAAPSTNNIALWDSRMWLIDAEDDTLWFSKPIVAGVPVEFSDLQTVFISPTQSVAGEAAVQRSKVLAAMDDKLIAFKPDAIYYIGGQGPDSTGANNGYSDPVFITGTVGCSNPNSIAFIPSGIMFQSDKGIWHLGRDMSTSYIGAPVEAFNASTVVSAYVIPGTNQVRFLLDSGVTLFYDYYFQQWGTFSITGISSTLYNGLHTLVDNLGRVLQETPGVYLDGTRAVQMSFTTSWVKLAGLQGYQRAYFFTLLGTYLSPHSLNVQVAFDYAPGASQSDTFTPPTIGAWGSNTTWGAGAVWGGGLPLEQWRVFMKTQRCQAFQITVTETASSGAGLTLSGINCVVGVKKAWKPISAARSV